MSNKESECVMKQWFFSILLTCGLCSPLSAEMVDQCTSFKSPDGQIEYVREASSAPCLERKVISITDHYLGAQWKLENDTLTFSQIPIDEEQSADE